MKCSFCGKEYVPGSRYCHGCFTKVEDAFGIVSKIPLRQDKEEIEILIIDEDVPIEEKIEVHEEIVEVLEPVKEEKKEVIEEEKDDFLEQLNAPVVNTSVTIVEEKHNSIIAEAPKEEVKVVEEKSKETPKEEIKVEEAKPNTIKIDVPKEEVVKEQKKNDSKENRRLGISIVILLFVIALSVFITLNITNKEETPKNDVVNLANDDNTIVFASYTLTLPDGFIYNVYNGTDYIQNDDVVIMFKEEAPLGYQFVVDNKVSIIESLNNQGLKVKSFNEKEYNGNNYVLIIGEKSEGEDVKEYGYVFGDLSNDKPVCATIRSKSNAKFKEDWFIYAMEFLSTAK